jgi:hypothetical protein
LIDPVLIEIVTGFGPLRIFELAQALGLTVGKPIGVGTLIVLQPLGALTGRSKIDRFSHSVPRR